MLHAQKWFSHRLAVPFVAIIFALAPLLTAVPARAQQHASPEATRVLYYQPGANLDDTGRQGYCWTGSIAVPFRGDAWRCIEENAISDPCFTTSDPDAVVCGMNPATGEPGFRLTLTKPLPVPQPSQHDTSPENIWLLRLADDTYCTRFTGTRPFLGKSVATFSCTARDPKANVVLLDEPDTRRDLWIVSRVTLVDSPRGWRVKTLESVPVQTAWR
jgi:hypothetical protein